MALASGSESPHQSLQTCGQARELMIGLRGLFHRVAALIGDIANGVGALLKLFGQLAIILNSDGKFLGFSMRLIG